MANVSEIVLASIPSPSRSEWNLGPFPLRAYALAILVGIVVAVWWSMRRLKARGGNPDDIISVCYWAVPFGIVGGRIYHLVTSPDQYFGAGGHPMDAFKIWEGGLGIWGAVALGGLGAWIGCRRTGLSFALFADVTAPTILLAQGIGRIGNWFNQELFGAPTTLPWGLEIDPAHLPAGDAVGTLYHPTFLYELLWNVLGVAVLVWAERRYRLHGGQVFWLYVLIYTTGRLWIEMLRIDTAHHFLGVRLNVWTSIVVWIGALLAFVQLRRRTQRLGDEADRPVTEPAPTAVTRSQPEDS